MWSSPDFCGAKSGKNPSICGDGVHLPWKKFSAGFHGIYGCILDSAAAWNFHTHDGNTLDIVPTDDFGELFAVIYRVQFRTADKSNLTFDKILMEVSVSIGCAVCSNKKVSIVKIWSIDRN